MKSQAFKPFAGRSALVSVVLGLAGPALSSFAGEPTRIYDTGGSPDASQWKVVTGTPSSLDPKHTVLENGLIRLAYPCDFGVPPKKEQTGGWLLYLKLNGRYELAQSKGYGDWIYVGSSVCTDPTAFQVVRNTDDVVEVRMDFDDHVMGNKPSAPCKLRKTMTLHAGHYGYIAHVSLGKTDKTGEKEAGFGESSSHRFFFNEHRAHLRPDNTSQTMYLRKEGQTNAWWGAGLPTNHGFYRLLAVRPGMPGALRSVQWSPGTYGYFYQWTYAGCAGYEVYIATVPYDGTRASAITVKEGRARVEVPRAGEYTIFSQPEEMGASNAVYEVAAARLSLPAGASEVDLRGRLLIRPVIVPISNGKDFPEDICRQYHRLFPPAP